MTPHHLQSLRIRYSNPANPLPDGIREDVLALIAEVDWLNAERERAGRLEVALGELASERIQLVSALQCSAIALSQWPGLDLAELGVIERKVRAALAATKAEGT